ncbi:DeoR/GlpR family DNA-binding transcription regulator [Salirhabdus salicampi]|uniref:DeoR/GlpR family DNA-binding transcription regulator n=1 Tax=Salirhabdus salicampi TaxID=476102 RepID=UPI0020C41CF4|nr:DeoR/GlpR family DNA-binding transcription regulator [Salirhabdus salicampi]MCP8617578.1 DeoR/GlpR family DNA-binding transcription regulator [Salirhabdus salicampi]
MLVAERHQRIVELVNKRKSIRVSELSRLFSVTEETIRRDLEKLENDRRLKRSHGGAVSIASDQESYETPYTEREVTNVKEKRDIATIAANLVNEGDKIILDASSTALFMAKELPNISITVLTNSIKVAIELSGKSNVTVISTGGIVTQRSLSYVGPLTEDNLKNYHVDKGFISCKGLHLQHGISESSDDQARIKKKMCDISEKVYVMVDHSKFAVQSFSLINSLDKVDYVITDRKVGAKDVDEIQKRKVEVIQP